jgi:3-mercaptopyruvate sulfurtransferase SseA/sterol desaturase/sphingolipid hydroxylase (fatty acid hydroxylase superfamily)
MNFKNRIKYWAFFVLLVAFSQVNASIADRHIIAVEAAIGELEKASIQLIDVRKAQEYAAGHVLGAVNVWRTAYVDTTSAYGGVMPTREQFQELLSTLGVKAEDKIILYDGKGGCEAARFWWILKTYGHPNAYLVDGGFTAFAVIDSLITSTETSITTSKYEFPEAENLALFASLNEVRMSLEDPNSILLDTRSLAEFSGRIQKKGAFRAGRIPGSILKEWTNSIHYDKDKRMKSVKDLAYDFHQLGITKDKNVIVYCQSGVRSAHTTFVLTEVLGYDKVKNYDGSWIAWSYHQELPIDSGETIDASMLEASNTADYWRLFVGSFSSYGSYVWSEITFQAKPWYQNYFWLLILLSLVVWLLEVLFPWRKNQPVIRTDFWIDAFYMFFNFFIFNLVIFIAFCNLSSQFFKDLVGRDLSDFALIHIQDYPEWAQLLVFFVATDFIQWFTHVLLHRFDFLWRFHQVHHSVEEMGFAAHLRYHWMENVFYTPMKYIVVMLIGGFHPEQAFIIYYISIAIGHINHANVAWSYGPLKYVLNNPKMHIWHHAHDLPERHKNGANFGISLSSWDYLFRTNYLPHSGRDIKLGFEKIERFPKTFLKQLFTGFKSTGNK